MPTSPPWAISCRRPRKAGTGNLFGHWLVTDKIETHGRYVKFVISPTNLGNGSYVFLDELEIYRGEDAWLSSPPRRRATASEQWQAD